MTEHCDLNHAPIGVFDSGVGGLTVAREIMRQIPDERIVYFGDTARVPYGSKSPNTIIRYSRQIIRFFTDKKCQGNCSCLQYGECVCIRDDQTGVRHSDYRCCKAGG